jgi:chromosome segregation ATPase
MNTDSLAQLKETNSKLETALATNTQETNKGLSREPLELIKRLQIQGDEYTRKIETEKRLIANLQSNLKVLHEKVEQQRQQMGGIDGAERKQKEVARRLSQMENRLDNALIKYNRRVAENRDLKSEINAARRQRLVYDDIYASLELELAKKKKEMANLISKTSTAMQKQDRLKSKLKNVQQQIEQEQKEFNKRWHSLGTEISMGREAHTLKLKKEMEAQGSLKDGENEADIGKNGTDNGNANAIESSAASTGNKAPEIADNVEENSIERKTKRKLARGAWAIAKEKAQIHMSAEKIQAYEVAFEKIREITGIADIEVLVDRFIEAEERNFSTFKYISHLNKELERLDSQIHEARSEIERFRGQGVETDSQRKKILRELESKLHRTETRTKDFDDRHNRVATLLTSVKKRVQDIFHRIGCRNSVAAGFVGNQGVTDRYIFFIFIFFI